MRKDKRGVVHKAYEVECPWSKAATLSCTERLKKTVPQHILNAPHLLEEISGAVKNGFPRPVGRALSLTLPPVLGQQYF